MRTTGGFDFLAALPTPDLAPDEVIAQQQQAKAMLRALQTLPPREQEILDLKFVAGLSNVQVAEAIGLTPSNVGVIVFHSTAQAAPGNRGRTVITTDSAKGERIQRGPWCLRVVMQKNR